MKRSVIVGMLSLLLLALIQVLPVGAFATVTSFFPGCDRFTISVNTNQPYFTIQVYNFAGSSMAYFQTLPSPGTSFDITVFFPEVPEGTPLTYYVWGSPDSSLGSWDAEAYFNETEEETPCIKYVDPAPGIGIPAGFALRTITCDVPVYNTPGGSPVGDGRIRAGQTWYVNPTPVDAADGESWTEIFVSSRTHPFIPTRCVG
jgi:hypothetical protein